MYKVGMGSRPQAPACLNEEGRSFLDRCLEVDQEKRWTVQKLQTHQFVRVSWSRG